MKIRTVTKLKPDDFPRASFTGFESPYSDALRKVFPSAVIATLIEKLPPESRARLEAEFGPLPTTQTPHP